MDEFSRAQGSIRGERVAVKIIVQSHKPAIVADLSETLLDYCSAHQWVDMID